MSSRARLPSRQASEASVYKGPPRSDFDGEMAGIHRDIAHPKIETSIKSGTIWLRFVNSLGLEAEVRWVRFCILMLPLPRLRRSGQAHTGRGRFAARFACCKSGEGRRASSPAGGGVPSHLPNGFGSAILTNAFWERDSQFPDNLASFRQFACSSSGPPRCFADPQETARRRLAGYSAVSRPSAPGGHIPTLG
jgi:hypothetical protein